MVWTTGLVLIVIGVAILFWGYALFRIWFGIAGFLFGLDVGTLIGNVFFEGQFWSNVLSVGLGLFFGIFGFALYKFGAVLVGFFLGGALSIVIFFAFQMEPTWWIFLIGAIPVALIAAFFIEPYIKVASAVNGAYLIMAGILSLMTGEQPSIVLSGEVPWYFYLGLVVLTVMGAAYQFKKYKDKEMNLSVSKPVGTGGQNR